ncbi:MAG: hypothetical protein JXR94_11430, partial [Candidatus Hydrogenedentes bacterium]|nr:hypothetical protein [Candidatus Hydrogenedentota bacterium]
MNRIAAHILVIGLAAASAIPGRVAHACQDTTVRLAAFTLPRDTHVLCVIGAAGDPVADETAARLGDWLASEGADLNIEVEHVVADDPDVPW